MLKILYLVTAIHLCLARKHTLEITNDPRMDIALSTFGFYQGGVLYVQLHNFRAVPENTSAVYGFSLERTTSDAMNPYIDGHQEKCLLEEPIPNEHDDRSIIYFICDLKNKVLRVKCSRNLLKNKVNIYKSAEDAFQIRRRRSALLRNEANCGSTHLEINSSSENGYTYYNTSFAMYVASRDQEGLYNLYFHNCPNYHVEQDVHLYFSVQITEHNLSSYLSAGEMPLPALYCMMAILFLLSGMFWVFLLRQSHHPVFKIHYLMAVLVFLKALSLAFHGLNYHFIERLGVHLATWAVLFYVAHLLKGALLFVTLVLVGTGWTFIKHVLAPRDKRLFMAVIPLQVLANVAEIILAESEEGAREHRAWRTVFILVDLLCCGCILFPVVWSIRHLQEASRTDGKAAINLRKLKLFQHFYVMIVCYIYFTRIIVYLLKITVPFQYGWLDEMFREMATYVFFVLTGYKFRPAAHNPYFSLATDDEDEEVEVLTESGTTEGLNRVQSRSKHKTAASTLTEVTEEESDVLLAQRESSHDYD